MPDDETEDWAPEVYKDLDVREARHLAGQYLRKARSDESFRDWFEAQDWETKDVDGGSYSYADQYIEAKARFESSEEEKGSYRERMRANMDNALRNAIEVIDQHFDTQPPVPFGANSEEGSAEVLLTSNLQTVRHAALAARKILLEPRENDKYRRESEMKLKALSRSISDLEETVEGLDRRDASGVLDEFAGEIHAQGRKEVARLVIDWIKKALRYGYALWMDGGF